MHKPQISLLIVLSFAHLFQRLILRTLNRLVNMRLRQVG